MIRIGSGEDGRQESLEDENEEERDTTSTPTEDNRSSGTGEQQNGSSMLYEKFRPNNRNLQ